METNTVYLEYAIADYPIVSHYLRALREHHFDVMTEPRSDKPYILIIMFSARYVQATINFGSPDLYRRPSRPPERIVVVRLDATPFPPHLAVHNTILAMNMLPFVSLNGVIDALVKALRPEPLYTVSSDTGAPEAASTVESAQATPAKIRVFLSHHHSPVEDDFTDRLKDDLEAAGVYVWVDKKKLTPRTPDWEREIRKAIAQSDFVIYIGSEAARESAYVRDELTIADDEGVTILRVWALGEKWMQCVPLGRGVGQRIDMRGEKYEINFQQLMESLLDPEEDA